jgi:hypothetical protein
MKRLASAVAAASTLVTPAAGQESQPEQSSRVYYQGVNWTVYRNGQRCNLMVLYEEKVMLSVAYTLGTNTANLTVLNPTFTTIQNQTPYPLSLIFLKNGNLDRSWGMVIARGFVSGALRGVTIKLQGLALLDDLRVSENVALLRNSDTVVVASMKLRGSSEWVHKLEDCAKQAHKEDPADPFSD